MFDPRRFEKLMAVVVELVDSLTDGRSIHPSPHNGRLAWHVRSLTVPVVCVGLLFIIRTKHHAIKIQDLEAERVSTSTVDPSQDP